MNETRAIARLKRGDIGGLEWLVRAYQTQALRTAYLIVQDQSVAEDVVQTAFLKVYERIHQFDSRRPFIPWFLKIVSNDAIKALHYQKDKVAFEAEDPDDPAPVDWLSSDIPLPESFIEQTEDREALWTLLQDLTPEQRATLVLRYYVDLSSYEIANELDIPPGTVRWRLHTALNRLRGLIKRSNRPDHFES